MDLFQFLKDNSVFVSLGSLVVSLYSFFLARWNYKNFARNEFIKKQIETITNLVLLLHKEKIVISFARFGHNSMSASEYRATLFEISELKIRETDSDYFTNNICFRGVGNQLILVKEFIDNPFLPKSIADQLENFYVRYTQNITKNEISGYKAVLLNTQNFESPLYQSGIIRNPSDINQPDAFAFINWENFLVCSRNLEYSLITFLKNYNVQEINIRKDFKEVVF